MGEAEKGEAVGSRRPPSLVYICRKDGMCVLPDGALLLETPGLSEDLRLLSRVMRAQQAGAELFRGQVSVAPLLQRLFDKPLQVLHLQFLQSAPTTSAPEEEIPKAVWIAKPADGVAVACAAIRALTNDL